PAARRDSVKNAQRMTHVIDSLVATGMKREALENLRKRVESGDTRGLFGGGGRGSRQGFQERPGESPLPGAAGRGNAGGGIPGLDGIDQDQLRDIMRAFRGPGAGGFFGGTPAPLANSGDYVVTLQVGGQTHRQLLRVERAGPLNGNGIANEVEGDEP
ncbi:MAG TPA: hypothetical protein VFT96_03400, partial [Gemmatimonadaceae bacterium]|nr:hypothetical protein [Gemmatimonadaceae bacterium]